MFAEAERVNAHRHSLSMLMAVIISHGLQLSESIKQLAGALSELATEFGKGNTVWPSIEKHNT